ncbi:Retrovirus-related Pol polyprotein from transposon TNT 1-94 [Vitis vinifera]|uniref:Retrovirus-related Pol polyprotein from transposon TNT 1-94 n=1 Tax=Vitis vinifera TaxID=29760 RepID=A0A438EU76_VITVI|nr:Retrovirus-related Pol polyprotein from transposon TNT 1-94 [Vitis vinifera]
MGSAGAFDNSPLHLIVEKLNDSTTTSDQCSSIPEMAIRKLLHHLMLDQLHEASHRQNIHVPSDGKRCVGCDTGNIVRCRECFPNLLTQDTALADEARRLGSSRLQALVTHGPHVGSGPRPSERTYYEHWKILGSAKEREGLYYFDEANGEFVSEARPPLTLDYLNVVVFESTSRSKSKSNEALTSQESGSNPDQCRAFMTNIDRIQIPKNIQETLEIPEWRETVMEEIRALEKNGTWEVMTLLRGKKLMGCKWVFTMKYKADDTIERYKARLVAKSELEEEVFMTLPPGFCKEEEETNVCKLKKSLYGLKQSPRAWFDIFAKVIKNQRFQQGQSDHTVFFKQSNNGRMTILIVYVIDIILIGDNT